MQLTHLSNHLADAQNREGPRNVPRRSKCTSLNRATSNAMVGCAVVGLTRRNEEDALIVDHFAVKIGRPLHRTLQNTDHFGV
jgi:hypothetical protein